MDLKKLIEQNMTLFSLGLLLAGFLAGIGVVAYVGGKRGPPPREFEKRVRCYWCGDGAKREGGFVMLQTESEI